MAVTQVWLGPGGDISQGTLLGLVRGYSRGVQRFGSPKMPLSQIVAAALVFTQRHLCLGGAKATGDAKGHWGQVGLCHPFIPAAKSDLGLTGPLLAVGARDAVVVTLLGPQPAFGSWAEARLCAHVMICSVQHMKIHLRRVLFCLCLYYVCSKSRFFGGTSVL